MNAAQRKFAMNVVAGMSHPDAYAAAYQTTSTSIASSASHLAREPEIAAFIATYEARLTAKWEEALLNAAEKINEWIQDPASKDRSSLLRLAAQLAGRGSKPSTTTNNTLILNASHPLSQEQIERLKAELATLKAPEPSQAPPIEAHLEGGGIAADAACLESTPKDVEEAS